MLVYRIKLQSISNLFLAEREIVIKKSMGRKKENKTISLNTVVYQSILKRLDNASTECPNMWRGLRSELALVKKSLGAKSGLIDRS